MPPLPGTGVPVSPVPLLPGHGGPSLFTVLVKLTSGVQAPLSMAHSEAFSPCSSSRRSSGWPGSAPGNVPGGWVGGNGRPSRAPPQLDPQAVCTLPPQQYSRSRRHWVSRTCPPLHTCPREWINKCMGMMWGCPWGSCGAEWCPTCTQRLGCGRSPPNSWGPCEWKGCSVTVTTILHKVPSIPQSPTHLPPGRLLQAREWLAGPGGHWLPAGHQLSQEVAGG